MKKPQLLLIFLLSITALFAQQVDTEYESQKKGIIKMEFFSPLTGNTTFGYERYIKDWVSWEAKVGIIGLGVDNQDMNARGILLKAGPKFKLNPDFVTRDLRGSHLLSGKYIRPELITSIYNEDQIEYTSNGDIKTRKNFSSFAIMINYGRQFILADIMSLDYHIGLGYGFDNVNSEFSGKYHYGHSQADKSFPIAISVGFTIGVLIK